MMPMPEPEPDLASLDFIGLIDAYRARFGETPPVFWAANKAIQADEVRAMQRALETREPWERHDLDLPPGSDICLAPDEGRR